MLKASVQRRPSRYAAVAATGLLLLQGAGAVLAAPALEKTVRVETFIAPPFVIEEGQELTGFSIDLWKEIAARLEVDTVYETAPTLSAGSTRRSSPLR
ncbi:MAG: transporter substrate-binding domain-containing protein [Proteobacteria bacterium]|nr:transporter substrate-binding domain-containing protein [Pseudomonadota bacterium]